MYVVVSLNQVLYPQAAVTIYTLRYQKYELGGIAVFGVKILYSHSRISKQQNTYIHPLLPNHIQLCIMLYCITLGRWESWAEDEDKMKLYMGWRGTVGHNPRQVILTLTTINWSFKCDNMEIDYSTVLKLLIIDVVCILHRQ